MFTADSEDAELSEPDEDDGTAEAMNNRPVPGAGKSYEAFAAARRGGWTPTPLLVGARRAGS